MGMINLFYLAAGIILTFTVFRITSMLSLYNGFFQKISPVLHFGEFVAWVFIFWESVQIFFSAKLYYPYLAGLFAIIVTLLLVWFYIKDIIAGFIFRIRHNPLKGQILRCETIHGTIRSIGLSQILIETTEGQRNRVPYSIIVNRMLSLQPRRTVAPGEISLEFNVRDIEDFSHFEELVRETLAQSFWCIASKPIAIQANAAGEDKIKISFFLLDPSYLSSARDRIINLINTFSQKKG